jgi:hypothetical protein
MIEYSAIRYTPARYECDKCEKPMILARERDCPNCDGWMKWKEPVRTTTTNRMTRKERKRRSAALKRSVERVTERHLEETA